MVKINSVLLQRFAITTRAIFFAMSISVVSVIFALLCYQTLSSESATVFQQTDSVNDRPIIGILTQEISYKLEKKYPGQYDSYIAASYVKFVEGAGARVVPIWIGQNDSYYEDILNKVNGVVWPGGATWFNKSNGYADAGHVIYRIAKNMNQNGDYFPIFGICLGFELMTYVAANGTEHRVDCSSQEPLNLQFKPKFNSSKMFMDAPHKVVKALQNNNVTANFHRYCVTEKRFANVGLNREFNVLSLSTEKTGVTFISAFEHKEFPFYGVQFHPEKNIYEWIASKKIPHGRVPTFVSQYFADFMINEARRNSHKFSSPDEERTSLIYNYPVVYTGLKKSSFVQCYMFKKPYYTCK